MWIYDSISNCQQDDQFTIKSTLQLTKNSYIHMYQISYISQLVTELLLRIDVHKSKTASLLTNNFQDGSNFINLYPSSELW